MTAINRFHFILLLVVIHLRFLSPSLSSCVYFCFVPVLYFLCFCFFYHLFFLQYLLSSFFVVEFYLCKYTVYMYMQNKHTRTHIDVFVSVRVYVSVCVYICACVCVFVCMSMSVYVCTTLSVHIFVNSLSSALGETIYSLPPFCSTSSIHSHTIPSIFHRCSNNLKYSAS